MIDFINQCFVDFQTPTQVKPGKCQAWWVGAAEMRGRWTLRSLFISTFHSP